MAAMRWGWGQEQNLHPTPTDPPPPWGAQDLEGVREGMRDGGGAGRQAGLGATLISPTLSWIVKGNIYGGESHVP